MHVNFTTFLVVALETFRIVMDSYRKEELRIHLWKSAEFKKLNFDAHPFELLPKKPVVYGP